MAKAWVNKDKLRVRLISCEIFFRELCWAIARSPNQVDVEFLPKGLHDIGCVSMRQRLQAALDRVEGSKYDAVVFGYGLCNNGLHGLTARTLPLVIPRAHDCMTLFFGSKERYLEYFNSHPGVYFKTTGWMERGAIAGELRQLSIPHSMGMDKSFEELAAQYGVDNARFLYDELSNNAKHYQQFTFIEMGIEPNDRFEKQARDEAVQRGWKFEKIRGDMSMLHRLVDGPWDDQEFLVVEPGWRVVAKYDEGIVAAEQVRPVLT